MTRGSVSEFLVRTVLDDAFRELARTDPVRAFEGFDLSAEAQEIIRSGDSRMLGLLGDAVAHREACDEQPVGEGPGDSSRPMVPTLPEIKLMLRLVPYTSQSPGTESGVSYAASLQPWPGDDKPSPSPGIGEQSDDQAGAAFPAVSWIIRIGPTVLESGEAGTTVAYSASIHPLIDDPSRSSVSRRPPARELASPPWNHHVESSAAKTAAQDVQTAAPDQRFGKLLELIHALQAGDEGD